jgi:hypothetical protein
MTTAAQLMAGGADQQLIATKLEETHEIGDAPASKETKTEEASKNDTPASKKDSIDISHDPNETLEQMDKRVKAKEQAEAAETAQGVLETQAPETIQPSSVYAPEPDEVAPEPTLGGTLNATTEQAAEDNRNETENDQNKTILSHAYLDASPSIDAPINGAVEEKPAATAVESFATAPTTPGAGSVNDVTAPSTPSAGSAYALNEAEKVIQPLPSAASIPTTPPAPADLGLPMPPAVPDFSQSPTVSPAYTPTAGSAPQPEILGDILAPDPSETASPISANMLPSTPPPLSPPASAPVNPNDPGQFKIPGQP